MPRDTRVAVALAMLVLLQTVALAAFGFAAARSQRAEAEAGLRTLSALALSRGLAEPAAEALSRVEAAAAAACARSSAPEAAGAPIQPAVFTEGFALLPDGSVVDARGTTVVPPRPPAGPEDAALRRRIGALEDATARDGGGRGMDAAREAVEAAEATEDPVAGCRALRFAARTALGAGEDTLALRACERLLDRWPDAWVEGEYPFGAGAAAVACEVRRRRLEARAPGGGAAFVEAALAWRRALLRAPLEPATAAAEAADVRRLGEGGAALLGEGERRALEEGLAALDRSDRAADGVRPAAVRAALRAAAAEGRPRWTRAGPGDAPLTFFVAPGAAGAAVAFRTDAPTLRSALVLPLARTLGVHEGVEVRLLTPDRRPLDGREEAPSPRATLAAQTLRLPTGDLLAEAVLVDAQVLEREAARSRNLLVAILAAAAAALVLGSLLVLRMVRAEVRLAKMKSEFVSAVSHDLKTPLTSIRMFLETLREGRARTEEERQECLEVVDREAGRLERMVNRILDFSRIEAGVRRVRLEAADPAAVAKEAAQVFRGRIGEGGCDFRVEAAPGIPAVPLDRDAVTQVLLELLENAHKHGQGGAGPRHVVLRAAPGPAAGVRFEVEDDGPGIPAAEREAVFREFHRVERPGLDAVGGTGLGLALARRLVEAHGGTVGVAEAPGGGCLFAVEIPGASERTV